MTMTNDELEEYRARIDAKRAITARFRAIDNAADHPTKAAPVVAARPAPARTAGVFRPRPRAGVKPCTTPGCPNMTRPNRSTTADFPGTRPRRGGGVCSACAYIPRLVHQPLDLVRLVELYESGRTIPAIAVELGASKTRTRRHLKDAFAATGRTLRDDRANRKAAA